MLDQFTIRPSEGSAFDVKKLIERLRSLNNVVELPSQELFVAGERIVRDDEFAICGTPESARRLREAALGGKGLDEFYGTIALVQIKPQWIWVHQLASPGVIALVRDLLWPIFQGSDCRIFSESGELMADYAAHPERLFEFSA